MYVIPPVPEFLVIGVIDANIANLERIVFRPTQTVDLAKFMLFLGIQTPEGGCVPLRDHFLWLGNTTVTAPSWIMVFTGPGQNQVREDPKFGKIHELHWGNNQTLFGAPNVVPILARMDVMTVGPRPLPPGNLLK